MKNLLWILLILVSSQLKANGLNENIPTLGALPLPSTPDVSNDTVFFDLQNAIFSFSNGTTLFDVPIYVKTAGSVSSFDFRMKFNQSKLTYVSTIKVISQLEPYTFLNPNDNFLRNNTSGPYVSYTIPNNTTLVYVRFQLNVPCTTISASDFFSITTLLVGYPCKNKVTDVTPFNANTNLVSGILCNKTPILFNAPTNASGVPISIYKWNIGQNVTSNLQSFGATFDSPGTYTANLQIETAEGCKDTISQTFTVNQSPVSNFSYVFNAQKDSVYFTNSSTLLGNSPNFSWDFGDSKTSIQTNAIHHYDAGGSYSVALTSRTAEGCTNKSNAILILDKPTANFMTNSNICVGSTINFISTSVFTSGKLNDWAWDFGDSTTANEQNPSHIFKKPGSYTVTLVVTSDVGSKANYSKTFLLTNKPVIDFLTNSISGCSPFSVSFSDESITNDDSQYQWDFGDFQLSTDKNPSHTFVENRSYNIKEIITTKGGCRDSITKQSYITVLNVPISDFTNSIGCANTLINFTDKSTVLGSKITAWFWDFGDGTTSSVQNPTHVYSKIGTYKVTLTTTTSIGCSNTTTKDIIINSKPIVQFNAKTTSGCLPLSPVFTDFSTAVSGSTYQWIFGDSTVSTDKTPNHTYVTDGLFTVKEIVTAPGGCSDSLVIPGYIYALNAVTPKFSVKNFCANQITEFKDSSSVSSGTIKNWKWEINNDIIQSQNKSYVFTKAGKYTIKLTVSSDQNCENSIQKDIQIDDVPKIDFTSDKVEGCFPEVVNFTNNTVAPSDTKYKWDFGDGTKDLTSSPFHKYLSMDTFTVKCYATSPLGCQDSLIKPKLITIHPVPTAKFGIKTTSALIPNLKIAFDNESSNANEFLWEFGDNTSSALTSPQHAYIDEKAASYQVCLTAYSSKVCSTKICDSIKINYSTQLAVPSAFSPNGDNNNDVFKILGGPITKLDLKIFNEWGNEIFSSSSQNDGWDGTYKNVQQPVGAYNYSFIATTIDGKEVSKNGIINLTR